MSLLALWGAGAALFISTLGLLECLHLWGEGLRGWVAHLVSGYLLACATVVALSETLSELGRLGRAGLLLGHAALALILAPLALRFLHRARPALLRLPQQMMAARAALSGDRALWLLSGAVGATWLLGAYLVVRVPPNTWDSYHYHLARVAAWVQQGSLHHYATQFSLRNAYPINAEIGLLWWTALWGNDRLAGFMQWGAALAATLCIYGAARRLNFARRAALWAALLWNTLTIVVVQTTSTKNDLLLAALSCALLYLWLAVDERWARVLFGLAWGLACGTKYLVILLAPGFLVWGFFWVCRDTRRYLSRLLALTAWCVIGFAALGAYNYILNWQHYGAFNGPAIHSQAHAMPAFSAAALFSNLARIAYHFCDPGGLPYDLALQLQKWREQIGPLFFAALRLDPNPPGSYMEGVPFDFRLNLQLTPREDAAWYGPLGCLLFLPTLGYPWIAVLLRRHSMVRHNTAHAFVALVCLGYFVGYAATLRWIPWMGRMMLIPVTVGAPLLAYTYGPLDWRRLIRWPITLLALTVLVWSATQNFHKPLFGPQAIWNQDYYELRALQSPEMAVLYRRADALLPPDAPVGLLCELESSVWDYLFLGPSQRRPVTYLGHTQQRMDAALFAHGQVRYLILGLPAGQTADVHLPLHFLHRAWDLDWYWVERSEAARWRYAGDVP